MFKCQTVLLSQMTGFRGTATYVAPLEIIGKIRRRAGDQTAEILPRLMMIELPCTGRRRDGRKRKRKGGQGGPRAGRGTIFHENSDYHLLACLLLAISEFFQTP